MMQDVLNKTQRGFVLPTALMILALLTMLSLTVYFGSQSTQKMSAAAQQTTQAYYYAETAANYMLWVLQSDAELDSYAGYAGGVSGTFLRNGAGNAPFAEVPPRGQMNPYTSGDYQELLAGLSNPGPVEISDTANNGGSVIFDGTTGQVMYFDNTPLSARAIVWPDAKINPPVFDNISVKLPRYIKIDIDVYGNVAPDFPTVPHQNPPVVGDDIPQNGAVAWLTASIRDPYGNERDTQILPLDAYGWAAAPTPISPYATTELAPGQTVTYPNGVTTSAYPGTTATGCSLLNPSLFAIACDAYSNTWIGPSRYQIAIYALGYVNGKPMRLVRKTF